MDNTVFVTLFVNDGLLETRTAKPFRISLEWPLFVLNKNCCLRLYGHESSQARVFSQTGVEIDSPMYIQYGESLIVSRGEDLVPINYLSKVPVSMQNNTQLANMLKDLHQQSMVMSQGLPVPQSRLYSMHDVLQEAIGSYIDPNTNVSQHLYKLVTSFSNSRDDTVPGPLAPSPTSSSVDVSQPKLSSQLENLFANMFLPSVSLYNANDPAVTSPSHQSHNPAMVYSPPTAAPPAAAADAISTPVLAGGPTSPTGAQGPPMGCSAPPLPNSSSPSLHHDGVSLSPTALSPLGRDGAMPRPAMPMVPSAVDDPTSPGSLATWPGDQQNISSAPDRISSHKASEQRSRAKLKRCLSELCLSVPALQQVRNPTKATVLKKAVEYVQETNTKLEAAKQAAEALAKDKEALLQEKTLLVKQLEISSISTLEITDAEHRFIFVDPTWEIVLGYSRQEVVGQLVQDLVDCPTCPFMRSRGELIKGDLENGKEWAGITVGMRRNGRAFVCETTITPVLDDNGDVVQYVTRRNNFHLLSNNEQGPMCQLQLNQGNSAPNRESIQRLLPDIVSV